MGFQFTLLLSINFWWPLLKRNSSAIEKHGASCVLPNKGERIICLKNRRPRSKAVLPLPRLRLLKCQSGGGVDRNWKRTSSPVSCLSVRGWRVSASRGVRSLGRSRRCHDSRLCCFAPGQHSAPSAPAMIMLGAIIGVFADFMRCLGTDACNFRLHLFAGLNNSCQFRLCFIITKLSDCHVSHVYGLGVVIFRKFNFVHLQKASVGMIFLQC